LTLRPARPVLAGTLSLTYSPTFHAAEPLNQKNGTPEAAE
jgi:hypothetical protein